MSFKVKHIIKSFLNLVVASFFSEKGKFLHRLKKQTKAIKNYDKAIEWKPDFALPYFWRGISYHDIGNYLEAKENYSRAILLNPNHAGAYYNRAQLRYRESNYKGAVEDCAKVLEINEVFIVKAYIRMGWAKFDLKDYEGAIEAANEVNYLERKSAAAYEIRALSLYELKKYPKALENFNKLIKLQSNSPDTYISRGSCKARMGNQIGAIEDFNKAIELKPDYDLAFLNRGITNSNSGNFNAAIENYNKAIELNPKNAKAYYCRGGTKDKLGDKKGAIEDLTTAVELKSDYKIAIYTLAQYLHNEASKLMRNKRITEALKLLEKAISIVSDKSFLSQLYLNYGYAYLMMEDYKNSLSCYFKALELRPVSDYAFANVGFIYTITDELEKAKEFLDKVSPYNKNLKAYLMRNWALYYMKKGDSELAQDYFIKAFNQQTPVDFLEYFYAKYLFSKSDNDEGMRYLAMSVDKGEKRGKDLMDLLSAK